MYTQGSLDNINLFSLITVLSFFLLTPIALLRDGGFLLTPNAMHAMGIIDTKLVLQRAVFAGFCFHAYQQVRPGEMFIMHQQSWGRSWRLDGKGDAIWRRGLISYLRFRAPAPLFWDGVDGWVQGSNQLFLMWGSQVSIFVAPCISSPLRDRTNGFQNDHTSTSKDGPICLDCLLTYIE